MGVEDSGIKEGRSFAFVPEILGFDVESCAFLSICASERESLSSQQLESGFDTNVGATSVRSCAVMSLIALC